MKFLFQGRPAIALRVIISALLTAWLLSYVDFRSAFILLNSANITLISVAVVCVLCTFTLNCLRWKLCLLEDSDRIPFRIILVSYWTSGFVGLGLPSEFGGDVLRTKDMLDKLTSGVNAVASVFWSRLSGFAATLFVFVILGFVHFQRLEELSLVWLWALSLASFVILVVIIFSLAARQMVKSLLKRLPGPKTLMGSVAGMLDRLQILATHRVYAWKIYAFAIITHLLRITTNTLYAWSLAQPVMVLDMVLVVTIVTFSCMLPISIAGIGVKEGAFVIGLTAVGVSPEAALSIALLNRTVLLAVTILGGILFPFRHRLLKI